LIEYRWPLAIRCQPPSQLIPLTRSLSARSPLRADTQSGGAIVRQWRMTLNFTGLTARDHRSIAALINRLDGVVNTLRIGPHDLCKPLGAAAGWGDAAPLLTSAAFSDGTRFSDGTGWTEASRQGLMSESAPAGRDTIIIGGLLPNRTDSLLTGDMMEIGGYLYSVQNDCASDHLGRARAVIWPRLRRNAPAGTAVLFDNPTSPFHLADGSQTAMAIGLGHLGNIGLDLIERLPE
jgi:hypothetical protein